LDRWEDLGDKEIIYRKKISSESFFLIHVDCLPQ
jgi:hypothetical protein